jgi:hypothetical protein
MPYLVFVIFTQLMFNLKKTKVVIFNGSKPTLSEYHFYFWGVEIKITTAYTYLGVQFLGPRFGLRKSLQPQSTRAMDPSLFLSANVFGTIFKDIQSKMDLMDNLIRPMVLYGFEV